MTSLDVQADGGSHRLKTVLEGNRRYGIGVHRLVRENSGQRSAVSDQLKVGCAGFWLPVVLIFAGSMAFGQTAKTISGSVVDDSGAVVAGTKVYYRSPPTTVRDKVGHTTVIASGVASSVATAKDGTFSVAALPAGVYWLCAEVLEQGQQIRSCDWGFGGAKVDLTTAASASNVTLQVHSGVTVTFMVNDAKGQIKDFAAGTLGLTSGGVTPAAGNFRILVVSGTWLRPAQLVSVSGGVHQYAVTVPATRTLRLLIDTKLNVVNQQSEAVLAGKPNDTITVNGQPMSYTMTVQ